jgi:hypothetical protein
MGLASRRSFIGIVDALRRNEMGHSNSIAELKGFAADSIKEAFIREIAQNPHNYEAAFSNLMPEIMYAADEMSDVSVARSFAEGLLCKLGAELNNVVCDEKNEWHKRLKEILDSALPLLIGGIGPLFAGLGVAVAGATLAATFLVMVIVKPAASYTMDEFCKWSKEWVEENCNFNGDQSTP